mmetsp:Transcript_20096/g.14817  ORF Transcript_20096/g.14817 Transcript_20096/m.14817 type:complete len:99 (+) Transcript_20096:1211-1507(+)
MLSLLQDRTNAFSLQELQMFGEKQCSEQLLNEAFLSLVPYLERTQQLIYYSFIALWLSMLAEVLSFLLLDAKQLRCMKKGKDKMEDDLQISDKAFLEY